MYKTFSRKNTQKISSFNFLIDFLIFGSGGAEEKLAILDKKKKNLNLISTLFFFNLNYFGFFSSLLKIDETELRAFFVAITALSLFNICLFFIEVENKEGKEE